MKTTRFAAALAAAAVFAATAARADGGVSVTPPTPLYTQECAACHLAFPPGMLPASSWQRLMANLPKHFGVDASLEPAQMNQLTPWLVSHAGTVRRITENPPQDRISQSSWFVRKHDDVSAATWKRASIQSAANCVACHRGAEQGDFEEDNVRIPK